MPETNDFINRLLSRNNDELDDILSYADNKKSESHISNIKREDADAILKELDAPNIIAKTDSLNKNANKPLNLNSDAQKNVSHTPDIRKITVSDSGLKKTIPHISAADKTVASDSYIKNRISDRSDATKAALKKSSNKNSSETSDVKVAVAVHADSGEAKLHTSDTKTGLTEEPQSDDINKPDIKISAIADQYTKKSASKARASSKNISVSPVPHNFHHIHLQPDICEYISYKSICDDNQPVNTNLIPEETRKMNKIEIKEEIPEPKAEKEPEPQPQLPHEEIPLPEPGVSSTEKFLLEQEEKHPRFYFALGISIFLLTILGLASCIYLGLNALRTFTKNYNSTTVTSYYENSQNTWSPIWEKTL